MENFFLENVRDKKSKFIFTHNFSRKNLIIKLKKENIEQENVFIDDENVFYLDAHKERIYPAKIVLVDGRVSGVYSLR